MATKVATLGFDEIELNLGCPNVRVSGVQESIISFNPERMEELLAEVFRATTNPNFAVKLSPYSDPSLLLKIAEVLEYAIIGSVVTSNTFPNGSSFNQQGRNVINANDGYAGVAGTALHEIALGQVRQFTKALPSTIDVTGVGGVRSGETLRNMELAGATRVQIATHYFNTDDPRVFQRIAESYVDLYGEV